MNQIRKNSLIVYLLTLVSLSILFYVTNTLCHGAMIRAVFLAPADGTVKDALNDHFYTIKEQVGNPYLDYKSIYPPMANLFYKFWASMIPDNLKKLDGRLFVYQCSGFILFFCSSVYGIACCIRTKIKNTEYVKSLAVAAFIMSAPLMFTIERGNIIILAVLLSFIFVIAESSDRIIIREIGLICLAIAFSIKIYPAIYGILLLRDKKWAEAVRCSVYGILFMTVPFLAFGGWPVFKVWVRNLGSKATGIDGIGYGYTISLYSMRRVFEIITGVFIDDRLYVILLVLACVSLVLMAFLSDSKWRALLAATLLLILVPNASYYYSTLFLWIPLSELLSEKVTQNSLNGEWALAIPLAVIMIPWAMPQIPEFAGWYFAMSYSHLIYDICLVMITVVLCMSGFINTIGRKKNE